MKNTSTLLALFFSIVTMYGQDQNIQWQKTIGGNEYDLLETVKQTPDGGYILGGHSLSDISGDKTDSSNGDYDFWIIKTNSIGEIEWQNSIGGSITENLRSIELTPDGGYIASGMSISNISGDKSENCRGSNDYWMVKLDSLGNVEWDKTIGGSLSDQYSSVIVINDGYYICGSSYSNISGDKTENSKGNVDYWILKLDTTGNIVWQKTIGGSGTDYSNSITKTADGGCIIAGNSDSNISGDKTEDSRGLSDFWIVKLSAAGVIEWDKTIGGNDFDGPNSIIQMLDDGFLIAGISSSNISGEKTENSKGGYDYWIVKVDANGNIEWDKTIGGSDQDLSNSFTQANDGGFLLGGFSNSNISGNKTEHSKGTYDYWILKLNNVGLIEWQNTIGGGYIDRLISSTQANDGGFLLGGYSESNISADKTENSRGTFDYWIIKHGQTLGMGENTFANTITLYPNPTKNTLQLNTQDQTINQVNIYTMTGSKVLQLEVDSVSPTVDVSSLASGVYYVQLYSGKNVALKKFIKE